MPKATLLENIKGPLSSQRHSPKLIAFPAGRWVEQPVVPVSTQFEQSIQSINEDRLTQWFIQSELMSLGQHALSDLDSALALLVKSKQRNALTIEASSNPGTGYGRHGGYLQPAELLDLYKLGLSDLLTEIQRSRQLLDWPDNWDDDGSPGFDENTWFRTVDLLLRIARAMAREADLRPRDSEIMPGSEGGLTLEIQYPEVVLLFDVPSDAGAPVHYYGRNAERTRTVKGQMGPNEPARWLVLWMTAT